MADVIALGKMDMPAGQILKVVASHEPEQVSGVIKHADGSFETFYSNMEIGDLAYMIALLSNEMHAMISAQGPR